MKFILLILISKVFSFGYLVHSIIGDSVQEMLQQNSPETMKMFRHCQLLNSTENLSNASVWADRVKRSKEFSWTKKLHYFSIPDFPPDCCSKIPEIPVENNNILTYLDNFIKKNIHAFQSPATATVVTTNCPNITAVDFKIALHLFQDLHNPLHLTAKLRGGNNYTIIVGKRKMSLHSYWDTYLFSLIFKGKTYQEILDYFTSKQKVACPLHPVNEQELLNWTQEISDSNCNGIWETHDFNANKVILLDLISTCIQRVYCILQSLVLY